MDMYEAAEILRQFWLEGTDTVSSQEIVPAKCPFCGKTDRIRHMTQTEPKDALSNERYRAAFEMLSGEGRIPGFCGFCLNVVRIYCQEAEPLKED